MIKNPFPGPQPYRAMDRRLFYGRDDLARKLESVILATRCITVHGPSGAGKSSLVQAAVFPALVDAREVRVVRVDAWPEGEEPTSWLARAVFSELRLGDVPTDQSAADAVLFAVRRAARASERLVIVYLDQLEQLFFTGRSSDETENFFKCLQALGDLPVRSLRLVLSLREDYLGRFRDRLRDRGRLLENTFRVGPLDVRELTEAVCQAARAGEPSQEWKPDAIRNLMLQVRVPGQAATDEAEAQAAYAQIVCRALFHERAQGQTIADDKVEAEPIMVRYLDSTLSSLSKLEEPARRLLGDHMVSSDGSRTLRTEKELLRIMPEAELFPILEALEKAAILHAAEHQGSRYFEIGHDWLARKVFDERALREAREAAKKHESEMQRQFDEKQKEIAQRLDDERKRRKRLALFSAATLSVAILTSALGILAYRSQKAAESARRDATRAQYEALRKRIEASDQRLLVGYAALSNQGHQSIALKLLPEVKFPKKISGWLSVASDALSENRLRVTLSGHTGPIVFVAFSPNGQHVLTASGDGTARIWNANGDGIPVVLSGHKDAILTAAWSPDGRRVLTTSGDGTACIWNASGEGSPIRIDPGAGPIWAGAFAPDGQHVALGVQDGSLRIIGLDGQSTVTLAAKTEKLAGFHALAFLRGSEQLIGATNDGAVHLWSIDAPSKPTEVGRHEARIESLAVSSDGTKLLTAAGESSAKLFFLDGKKATKPRLLSCDQGSAIQSALSPDGSLAAVSCNDFRVRIFSTNEDKPPVVLNAATAFITKLAFRDNSFLAVSSLDSVARVYSVAGGPARLELRGHTGAIGVLSFSPDRKWLVTGAADDRTKDFTARIWNVAALDELPAPIRTQLPYHGIALRKDGIFVAGAFDDDVVRVRRVDGKGQTVELRGHSGWISRVAWAQDGERIVTSSFDQTARVWRADGTGDPIILGGKDNDGHTAGLRYAAFSRDGTLVVTASEDRTAKVWQANRADKPLVTLSGHDDWVTAASIAPDGKRVATGSQDQAVRVFTLDKPTEPLVFRTHQGSVNSVQFSPDGSRIASASDDGTVRIIFAENQEMPIFLRGNGTGMMQFAVWSADGKRVAAAATDHLVYLWNADGVGDASVLAPLQNVTALSFLADDHILLAVLEDGSTRHWRIDIPELLDALGKANADCLPPALRVKFFEESDACAANAFDLCESSHGRRDAPASNAQCNEPSLLTELARLDAQVHADHIEKTQEQGSILSWVRNQDPPPPPSPPGPPTAPSAPQRSLKDMGPDGCHVRVVVLPGDADVTIDGSPVRRKDGAIDLLGHRGDVVRMRVSKAGKFVEADVKLDPAGAIPPVVALAPKLPADRPKP